MTPEQIIDLMARQERLERRVRALEAALSGVEHEREERVRKHDAAPVMAIVMEVADEYGVSIADILSSNRSTYFAVPRHEVMRRAIDAGLSTTRIGRALGRDHTTVIHGAQRARERASQ